MMAIGNFGYSVKLNENTAIVGCPGEAFYTDSRPTIEVPNYGRSYIFKKGDFGYFTQKTVVYPLTSDLTSYKFFGSQVNTFKNLAVVGIPLTMDKHDGKIDIFNIDCLLPEPAPHLTIPVSALQQLDESGFIIDKMGEDYMVKGQFPDVEILYTPSVVFNKVVGISPFTVSLSGFNRAFVEIKNWYWNMSGGDVPDYATKDITHTYNSGNTYKVFLSAINDYGTGIQKIDVTVIDPVYHYVSNGNKSIDISDNVGNYIIVDQSYAYFTLLIDSISGITFKNNFDTFNFGNCNISIESMTKEITSNLLF